MRLEGGGQTLDVESGGGYDDVYEELNVTETTIFVSEVSKFFTESLI